MRLLVLTGALFPTPGNNANLLSKILPFLAEHHEVRLLSTVLKNKRDGLPSRISGLPVYWVDRGGVSSAEQKYIFPAISKLMDPDGKSDVMNLLHIRKAMNRIRKEYSFDAILSTMEPFPAAAASAATNAKKHVIYLMDPPELVQDLQGTKFRNRHLKRILTSQDAVLTTPFIKDALLSSGMKDLDRRVIPVGFPMVEKHDKKPSEERADRIRLLFTGWMCSSIRSPKYFLDIVSRLDERFEVTFMGKECQLLQKRFPTRSRAELVTLPNQPYEVALQAMADADILINIGNSVPVHMPSKTLEYINTGKPFVNFYKMDDCPTLYYTKRYPLCLNMSEKDEDLDAAARRFVDFCLESKGKTVDRNYIESEYADCTPQYIAQKILDALQD